MGGRSLAAYAKASFGVVLTEEQASAWREELISKVDTELAVYLKGYEMADLDVKRGFEVEDGGMGVEFVGQEGGRWGG